MHNIQEPVFVFLAMIPPEDMARYIVTAFFTIINLLVTYWFLKRFLFKPAVKIIRKRQASIDADLANARETKQAAHEKLSEATARIESSVREASAIVNEAKVQAESQSDAMIMAAKKEVSEIISRADTDIERMRIAMMEEMRDEVADGGYRPLGQILLERGLITTEKLDEALAIHWKRGILSGEIMRELGFVTEKQIVEALNERKATACV